MRPWYNKHRRINKIKINQMFLATMKKHSGKISFFAVNILVIIIITLYIRQQALNNSLNVLNAKSTTLKASATQRANTSTLNAKPAVSGVPSAQTKVS
jgi:hypothetical protein